jgi:hypothetical protein
MAKETKAALDITATIKALYDLQVTLGEIEALYGALADHYAGKFDKLP